MEWLDSLIKANTVVLALFGISIFGAMVKFLKWIRMHAKAKESARKEEVEQEVKLRQEEKDLVNRRLEGLEKANVAILHNKIYRQCDHHLTDGYITIDDLDDLSYLFNAYKSLGGNGTGEVLYNKVKSLPNKKQKEGK